VDLEAGEQGVVPVMGVEEFVIGFLLGTSVGFFLPIVIAAVLVDGPEDRHRESGLRE